MTKKKNRYVLFEDTYMGRKITTFNTFDEGKNKLKENFRNKFMELSMDSSKMDLLWKSFCDDFLKSDINGIKECLYHFENSSIHLTSGNNFMLGKIEDGVFVFEWKILNADIEDLSDPESEDA